MTTYVRQQEITHRIGQAGRFQLKLTDGDVRIRPAEGDEVRLKTRRGTAAFNAQLTTSIRMDTLFVPFHFGGMGCANLLTDPSLDPTSRMPAFKVCAVRIEKRSEC